MSVQYISLGITLAVLGLIFWLLAKLLIRSSSSAQPRSLGNAQVRFFPDEEDKQPDAVIFVRSGGQILNANAAARRLFDMREQRPDLEKVTRMVRPVDLFLRACSNEMHTRLEVNGRMVECVSYRMAVETGTLMLVSLHVPELTAGLDKDASLSDKTLQIFTELGQAMAASLDLDVTIRTILESVGKLIPAQILEITLWDEENKRFAPYRLVGSEDIDRKLEPPKEYYPLDEGFSGYLARMRKGLLLPDAESQREILPGPHRSHPSIRSYVGLPLTIGNELVGTLELFSNETGSFQQKDLDLLELLSGQAAIAIHNALLYRQERHHSIELSGLAELARTFTTVRDRKGLFDRLVLSIIPLVRVEIIGFLRFNKNQRTLEGQLPFFGLPPQIVEIYRSIIPANSAGERLLLNQEVICTENACEDERLADLRIQHIAQAASMRDTILIPLAFGGRMLGYLQASNHLDGSKVFTKEEINLLKIAANQAAPVIEHAILAQQTQQRTQRTETLRRIARLAGTADSLDEILSFGARELGDQFQADVAAVFLVSREQKELFFHPRSFFGTGAAHGDIQSCLPVDDPQFAFTATSSLKNLTESQLLEEKAVIPFYRQIISAWNLSSVMAVPLVVRGIGVGEIWLGSSTASMFDHFDLQVLVTAAGQMAWAVDYYSFSRQTDESLRRQVEDQKLLLRMSREMDTSLDLGNLLQLVYEECLRETGADCGYVQVFIENDRPENQMYFHAGEQPPPDLLEIERSALETRKPCLLSEFREGGLAAPHPSSRSAVAVPITHENHIIGLISLHSGQPDHFRTESVSRLQMIGSQSAAALTNSRQHELELMQGKLLKRHLGVLRKVPGVTFGANGSQPLEEVMQTIAGILHDITRARIVLISHFDKRASGFRVGFRWGVEEAIWNRLNIKFFPWLAAQRCLRPEFRHRALFVIPEDYLPGAGADADFWDSLRALVLMQKGQPVEQIWIVPLDDQEEHTQDLVFVITSSEVDSHDEVMQDVLELFVAQASWMILLQSRSTLMENRLLEIEVEQDRLRAGAEHASKVLPLLLRKDLDHVVRSQSLAQQNDWFRAALELSGVTGKQTDYQTALQLLAREMLTRFDMQVALIGHRKAHSLQLISVIGSTPVGFTPDALFGQRNPLRQILLDGRVDLAADLDVPSEWKNCAMLTLLGAKSFIGLPFILGEEERAGVLAIGSKPIPFISESNRRIFEQISSQVSTNLQNLQLLIETRQRLDEVSILLEFTRKLGSLDPIRILHALLGSALQVVSEAHAGWVGLIDNQDKQLRIQAAMGYSDNFSLLNINLAQSPAVSGAVENLPLSVFHSRKSLRAGEIIFARDYSLTYDDLLNYRRGTGGRLPVSSLLVPLARGEHTLGIIVLDNFEIPEAFSEEDETLVSSLTQQAALALENARLYEESVGRARELDERSQRLALLNRLSAELSASLDETHILDSISKQLMSALEVHRAAVVLRDPNGQCSIRVEAPADMPDLPLILPQNPLMDHLSQTFELYQTQDVSNVEQAVTLWQMYFQKRGSLAWLSVPMSTGDTLIGWIWLQRNAPDNFSTPEVELVRTVANQAVIAIQNARSYAQVRWLAEDLEKRVEERTQELRRENKNTQTLLRIITELTTSLDMESVLQSALAVLNEALGSQQSVIFLTKGTPRTYNSGMDFIPSARNGSAAEISIEKLITDRVIHTREAIQVDRLTETKNWGIELDPQPKFQSVLAVPLILGQDVHGALMLLHEQPEFFVGEQKRLVEAAARQISIVLHNTELFKLIRDQAERLGMMLRDQQVAGSRSRSILEAVADGVLVTDDRNVITLFNASADKILDMKSSYILGQSLEHFSGLFGKAAQTWMETISRWSQNASACAPGESFSEQLDLDNGRIVSVHLAPVIMDKEFLGTVSVFRDITHQVQVDRLKSEFITNITHELRTPMTSIQGYIDILLMGAGGEVNPQQAHFLKIVRSNIERLTLLVNDLLDISKLESGRISLDFRPINIKEIVEEVVKSVQDRSQTDNKPIHFKLNIPPGLPRISGDPDRVRQILSHLIRNGYNYSPADGEITVRTTDLGQEVQVDVQDNGVGIPRPEQHRIFERFYRGNDPLVLATPGTGLGLVVCKTLVEMHNGRMWFNSSGVRGEGSTFSFTLPIYEYEEF